MSGGPMGDQNAPERIKVAVNVTGETGSIVDPEPGEYPACKLHGYVHESVHDRVVTERDEAEAERDRLSADNDELVGAESDLRAEAGAAERRADRYREALERLENKAHRLSTMGLALNAAEVRHEIAAALAEGEQPAPRVVHTEDCDGQRLSYHAATGDDMACVCGADDRAEGEQPAGERPDVVCPQCGGNGQIPPNAGPYCGQCRGSGVVPAAGEQSTTETVEIGEVERERIVEEARSRCEGISSHYPDLQFFDAICEVLTENGHLRPALGVVSTTETATGADVLDGLRVATANLHASKASRELLIQQALTEGLSEREIGRAAGLSGVSIHNRKVPAPATPEGPDAV